MPLFRRRSPASPRIIGLVPARNEEDKVEFALRALSKFTDAIVFLDDCSTDGTVQVVRELSESCRVEKIIEKPVWHRDEPGDRNRLLAAGRELGGSHFVVIDADEAFTANFLDGDALRKRILSLKPREQLSLRWIHLWRSVDQYRVDAPYGRSATSAAFFVTMAALNTSRNLFILRESPK